MKKLLLLLAFLGLLTGGARANLILDTSTPPGSPLMTTAGSTSSTMSLAVYSDNPPNDVMAAWNVTLEIIPVSGATGTLTFQDPATGSPAPPPNYVFGANGLGISVTNNGSDLTANDFYDPGVGPGAVVPGFPGANLLRLDFLASSNASGLFGIYAVEGAANTQWTDGNQNTQFFSNVPDGTGMVLIGEVLIPQAVPEPSTILLLASAAPILAAWSRWRK